jgi:hypothetical protein
MANVGTVGLAETLLDKGFEGAPLRVVGQGPGEVQPRRFGLAKPQRQLNIPVEIGHWKIPPPDLLGRSIEGVS